MVARRFITKLPSINDVFRVLIGGSFNNDKLLECDLVKCSAELN